MSDLAKIATGLLVALLISRIIDYRRKLAMVQNLEGFRCAFTPMSLFGVLLPTCKINPGVSWMWRWRLFAYKQIGSEVISAVPWLYGPPTIFVSSFDVMKQLTNLHMKIPSAIYKDPEVFMIVRMWGANVFTENDEVWRKHRRIIAPAFNARTYTLVWKEAVATYHEMIATEGWTSKNEIELRDVNPFMSKLALIIISRCGFGLPHRWDDTVGASEWGADSDDANGGAFERPDEMPFAEALVMVIRNMIVRLAVPRWMYKLPIKKLRKLDKAYASLQAQMARLLVARRAEIASDPEFATSLKGSVDEKMDLSNAGEKNGSSGAGLASQRSDILSRLVVAGETEGSKGLGDEELIGNVFIFLFAGHESTALTLSATLGFLALYPEEQQKAYEEVLRACPGGRDPTVDDYPVLVHTLSCFLEAARMFPAGSSISRNVASPLHLILPPRTDDASKNTRDITLPVGMKVSIDMVGVHYNPSLFPSPTTFRPSRFYREVPTADSSSPTPPTLIPTPESELSVFGLGPRACIGRRFAMTEGVAFLAMLVRDWELVCGEVEGVDMTKEGWRELWREKVMQGSQLGIGFGVGKVPIVLKRR